MNVNMEILHTMLGEAQLHLLLTRTRVKELEDETAALKAALAAAQSGSAKEPAAVASESGQAEPEKTAA